MNICLTVPSPTSIFPASSSLALSCLRITSFNVRFAAVHSDIWTYFTVSFLLIRLPFFTVFSGLPSHRILLFCFQLQINTASASAEFHLWLCRQLTSPFQR